MKEIINFNGKELELREAQNFIQNLMSDKTVKLGSRCKVENTNFLKGDIGVVEKIDGLCVVIHSHIFEPGEYELIEPLVTIQDVLVFLGDKVGKYDIKVGKSDICNIIRLWDYSENIVDRQNYGSKNIYFQNENTIILLLEILVLNLGYSLS